MASCQAKPKQQQVIYLRQQMVIFIDSYQLIQYTIFSKEGSCRTHIVIFL